MAYQEEEQVRLRRQRSKQAITLAMQGRWREAVAANQEIIASFPSDVDAYNRLGRAYIELGEYSLAKEAYERAIELDPYNIIAQKNLHRLSYLGEAAAGPEADSDRVEPQHFIEETGKAGVVSLYQLAAKEVLAKMVAGDRVYLRIDGPGLTVENGRGEYLGQIEPKHSQRLIKLMVGGNRYSAAIVSSTEDKVTVIIREVYQDPSQAGQLSFPPKGVEGLRPYLSDKMLRRELEYIEALGDESADIEDKTLDNEE
jgi:tetratricopeptide (TPR) repeat protein